MSQPVDDHVREASHGDIETFFFEPGEAALPSRWAGAVPPNWVVRSVHFHQPSMISGVHSPSMPPFMVSLVAAAADAEGRSGDEWLAEAILHHLSGRRTLEGVGTPEPPSPPARHGVDDRDHGSRFQRALEWLTYGATAPIRPKRA